MSAPLRLRYPTEPSSPNAVPAETTPPQLPPETSARGVGTETDVDPSSPPELDRARALMHQQQARSTAFASVQALF